MEISKEQIAKMAESYKKAETQHVAQRAVTKNGILESAESVEVLKRMSPKNFAFSIDVVDQAVANQKMSGRCWIFACLNVLRFHIEKELDLPKGTFELSQAYLAFFNKLERAAWFLEHVVATADKPLDDREVDWLFTTPMADGGDWDMVCALVKKYGAAVVGLTLDHTGIPKTVDARLSVARRILDRALSYGIRREDVYIDCLTLTVSAEQEAAAQTLEGLRRVKGELGLKTVLGVSNISFGLPARPLINQNFLTMAMAAGLDLPILNPNVDAMMAAVRCYHLLMNIDTDAREFIAAYGNATVSTSITSAAGMTAAPAAGEKRGLEEIISDAWAWHSSHPNGYEG